MLATWAWEYFRKLLTVTYSLPLHPEMQPESLLCKEKAIHQFCAEIPLRGSLTPSSDGQDSGNMLDGLFLHQQKGSEGWLHTLRLCVLERSRSATY